MSSLITISRPWHTAVPLFESLAFANASDSILLLQDAVYALQSNINLASFVAKCQANQIEVFALQEDCAMRGVDNKYPQISLIDSAEFVGLVVKHEKQVAW